MADYQAIYRERAADYDRLVSAEDHDGALLAAIERLVGDLDGARFFEVGCGTGRITRQLVERGAYVEASDAAPAMLEVARARLSDLDPSRWTLRLADARTVSVRPGSADVALAGWVFGHFRTWFADRWADEIAGGLDRLSRSLRPGGTLMVVETLGTGATQPVPPRPELAEYYAWLESERGFRRESIRTDYRFASAAEAAAALRFFFGEAFAETILQNDWSVVPECTGIWWRTAPR